jgi:hypothetical protein
VANPEQGGVELTLETRRGRADPGQNGYQSMNWYRSTLHVKPDDIVEVALRQPGENGAAAGRAFSLRIQAKQIR